VLKSDKANKQNMAKQKEQNFRSTADNWFTLSGKILCFSLCHNGQHRIGAFSSEPSANEQVAKRWLETWRAHDSHCIREQWLTVECYCFFFPSRLMNAKMAETGIVKIE